MPSNLLRDWAIQPDRNDYELLERYRREIRMANVRDVMRRAIWLAIAAGYLSFTVYGVIMFCEKMFSSK